MGEKFLRFMVVALLNVFVIVGVSAWQGAYAAQVGDSCDTEEECVCADDGETVLYCFIGLYRETPSSKCNGVYPCDGPVSDPTVTTNDVSSIGYDTATGGGNITDTGNADVTTRGVCWSTSSNLTNALSTKNEQSGTYGTGSFSLSISGLTKRTTYHVRAYAENSQGISYGEDKTFTTLATTPTVSIEDPEFVFNPELDKTKLTCVGNVSDDGGYPVTDKGFIWSTSAIPNNANPADYSTKRSYGAGTGSIGGGSGGVGNITGLTPGTTYHFRAYATNAEGTALSDEKTITTSGEAPPEILTSTSSVNVAEGSTATFQVKLSSEPDSDVTVTVSRSSGDSDISVQSGASLTFTTSDYGTYQTVTLAAAEDADTSNGTATIHLSASGLEFNPASKDVTANEQDKDTLALETDTTAVTVSEGSTATFSVKLTAQPDDNVSVTVSRKSGDTDISVQSGDSLTFTTSNWNSNQTVTLAAAEDDDTTESTATIQVAASGLTSVNVTATEQENDFVTSTAAVTVTEESTATFDVKLSREPASDVTVTVSNSDGDSDITVQSGASLTFTSENWSTYQTVTLAAADDADVADGTATIQVSASGWTAKSITATEDDTDVQGLNVDPTSVDVPEGGTAEFSVSLAAQPDADVTVTVSNSSGDADITVQSGATLTFTAANWDTDQTVTLAAAEDDDKDNGSATIQVSSSGLDSKNVTATEQDNDAVNFVTDVAEVSVPEGSTAAFSVRLSQQPAADVTVTVSKSDGGDADISIQSETSLTFTTENWDTDQSVTLAAAEDDDEVAGTATIQLSSDDIDTKDMTVTEVENDELTIKANPESVSIAEDDTADFTVELTAQPTDAVTVTVAKTSGDEDITVTSATTLDFTTENWDTPQTVSLAAAADADAEAGEATLELSADGFDTVSVTVTEADTDEDGIATDTDSLVISEGGSAEFSVYLLAQPGSNVTVSVTRTSGDENITVTSGETLEFTTENWKVAQAVTVGAAASDSADHVATLEVSADGYDPLEVTVTRAKKGDVNGDGLVDLDDLILTLKLLAGISPEQGETVNVHADVDGDGQIGVAEAIYLIGTLSQ